MPPPQAVGRRCWGLFPAGGVTAGGQRSNTAAHSVSGVTTLFLLSALHEGAEAFQ